MTMTDVMVDIETTGTDPARNAIIQIAAVKFNLDTKEVDPDVFDKALVMAPLRSWDEDTRQWWATKQDTYRNIIMRAEPALDVIKAYATWVGTDELRFWCKPMSFDYTFMDSYFKQYGLNFPHSYRTARDLNSYIAGLRANPEHPNMDHVVFQGTEHNARDDTFHQIRMLFDAAGRRVQAEIV